MASAKAKAQSTGLRNGERSVRYEKPRFEERKSMDFPKEIAEKFNAGRFCIQCSGCHGCR